MINGEGEIIEHSANTRYKGTFVQGKKQGKGSLKHIEGEYSFEGEFNDGIPES